MSKLYYKDPLISAYMAREFGVEFNKEGICEPDRMKFWQINCVLFSFYNKISLKLDDKHHVKFYIHPDSYHIFKPMVGDKDEDGFRFENGAWVRIEMNGTKRIVMANESYTAKRHNKPFFWPEEK